MPTGQPKGEAMKKIMGLIDWLKDTARDMRKGTGTSGEGAANHWAGTDCRDFSGQPDHSDGTGSEMTLEDLMAALSRLDPYDPQH